MNGFTRKIYFTRETSFTKKTDNKDKGTSKKKQGNTKPGNSRFKSIYTNYVRKRIM